MTTTKTLPSRPEPLPVYRFERIAGESDHVLFQVAHVDRVPAPVHLASTRISRRKPRRRLKKKVRVAGQILVACAFLAIGWYQGAASRAERPVPTPETEKHSAAAAPPLIRLSIEHLGNAADLPSEQPVSLPGYLLPDDNREEPAHEGS